MSRHPDRIALWRKASVLCLMLAACATTPPSSLPLDAAQQRDLLLRVANFSFTGRVAVAPQGGDPASVDWRQRNDHAKVKLSGPFGAGALQMEYSPTALTIVTGRGERLENGDAEQLLVQQLGFLPPFNVLRFWILGVPAPVAPATETRDATGALQTLSQQDWVVSYQKHVPVDTAAGRMQLPAKLVATRDNLRLTLVIDRWRMK